MKKLVSIIIPIYNTEKYLERSLKSVVAQTYENIEVILVDDGSKDNSPSICDAWAAKDSRIKVFHQKNSGLSAARNKGLKEASGEYITFLDSDDFMADNKLQVMVDAMERHHADMSCCDVLAFREDEPEKTVYNGKPCDRNNIEETVVVKEQKEAVWFFTEKFTGRITWVWNKIYTRQLIGDTVFDTDREIVEDTIFNAEIMSKLTRMVYIPQKLQYYFQRLGSVMNTGNPAVYTMQGKALVREYGILEEINDKRFQQEHLYSCLNKIALLETQAHFDGMEDTAKFLRDMYVQLYSRHKGKMESKKEKVKAICFLHMGAIFHLLKRKWYLTEQKRRSL